MPLELFLQYLISGLIYGSIYAIVAIGFNIIYNATGIINFAQGEFAMLGGMIASVLAARIPLWAAIAAAIAITAAAGMIIERVFLRAVARGGVLKMIITTIGLSIVIREAALAAWGEGVRTLPFFTGNEVSSVELLGAHFSPQIFWVLGTTALVVAGLTAFFKFTMMGKAMRGCSANRDGASLCGIDPARTVSIAFCLSAGIGAVAGLRRGAPHPDALRDRGGALDQGLHRRCLRRPRQQRRGGGRGAPPRHASSPSPSSSFRRPTRTSSASASSSRCSSPSPPGSSGRGPPRS